MNRIKLYKGISGVLFVGMALTLLWTGPLSACSSMGPGKHVGVVQAVQIDKGILMLIDAETGKPIAFSASPELLQKTRAQEKVIMTFKTEGARLVAQNIEPLPKKS